MQNNKSFDRCMIPLVEPRKTLSVNWEELEHDAKALARRLFRISPWKGIVSVTRGGLVPAAIIARALDIRLIETVCVIGYQPDDYNPRQANEARIILKHRRMSATEKAGQC